MRNPLLFLLPILFFLCSCSKSNKNKLKTTSINEVDSCFREAEDQGFVFEKENHWWLWGGVNDDWHFDIDHWELRPCQLHFGLGRESFPALIAPQYSNQEEADVLYHDDVRVLAVEDGDDIKVFPVSLMIKHEIINDVVNGDPIMVAYCVLADLGAVYTREYCDHTLTFALSGYTYSDPEVWGGTEAFVLWDRETESLWWPLIDRAVSGDMNGVDLVKYIKGWEDTSWGNIKEQYSSNHILVLKAGQSMEIPESWNRLKDVKCF